MKCKLFGSIKNWILLFFTTIILYSCTPTKNIAYFQTLQKDTTLNQVVTKDFELRIRRNDIVSITVRSISPDVVSYNITGGSTGPNSFSGYTINAEGNVVFPKLGQIHVEGMTRRELEDKLTKELSPYLKDPIVSVGFVNQHVTILGGVGNTQTIPIINEQLTIIDALALSGDIQEKGNKDNILVIRQNDNNKQFKRLNLSDHSVFYSPYFYLRPDDIVYVEPKTIKKGLTSQEILSFLATGLSIIFLILNYTRK